jgi:hypothetical protein
MPSEPGFLDRIAGLLGESTAPLRYGVGQNEKARIALQRELPNAPSASGAENPEADRYASTYLGAQKWGEFPAEIMNTLALDDIGNVLTGNWKEAVRRKHFGQLGIDEAVRRGSGGR